MTAATRIGIIGGGQLGLMIGEAAREMGYTQVTVLDPTPACPASAVAEQIVGMAAAVVATAQSRAAACARVGQLRDRLADGLLAAVAGAIETGVRAAKIPGNCHLRFPGVESEALLVLLDEEGICASAGSACTSGAMEPSHVLTAMGIPPRDALGSLRLSLGVTTTDEDIDRALDVIPRAVARLGAG